MRYLMVAQRTQYYKNIDDRSASFTGRNMTARAVTGDISSAKASARSMLEAVSRFLDEIPDNCKNNYGSKYDGKSNNRRYRFW